MVVLSTSILEPTSTLMKEIAVTATLMVIRRKMRKTMDMPMLITKDTHTPRML